jgi:hypothetical protein
VPPNTLSSRDLLQRVTLIAVLIQNFQPDLAEIPTLVMQAERKAKSANTDLQAELEQAFASAFEIALSLRPLISMGLRSRHIRKQLLTGRLSNQIFPASWLSGIFA